MYTCVQLTLKGSPMGFKLYLLRSISKDGVVCSSPWPPFPVPTLGTLADDKTTLGHSSPLSGLVSFLLWAQVCFGLTLRGKGSCWRGIGLVLSWDRGVRVTGELEDVLPAPIAFLIAMTICLTKATQGGRVCFGSLFEDTVHCYGREGVGRNVRMLVTVHPQSESR